MNIAVAQFAPQLGDQRANLETVRAFHLQAQRAGAELVVFPELALCGYQMARSSGLCALHRDHPIFTELLELSQSLPLIIGFAERSPRGRIYNAGALLARGEVRHLHRKVCLPTYGAWEEGKHFARGKTLRAFDYGGFRVALFVCYDFWYPPMTYLAACDDVDLMIVLANSSRDPDGNNPLTWELLIRSPAAIYGSYVVFCNRVGVENSGVESGKIESGGVKNSVTFWGGSAVVAPGGEVTARAGAGEELLLGTLEPGKTAEAHETLPLMRDADLDFTVRELQRVQQQRLTEND